jgi:hypothetical protein
LSGKHASKAGLGIQKIINRATKSAAMLLPMFAKILDLSMCT